MYIYCVYKNGYPYLYMDVYLLSVFNFFIKKEYN